jgi:hypothetical protein
VDNALLVGGFEGIGDLAGDRERLVQRDRACFDPLGQRRPLYQLHHQVVGTDVIDLADVGVIQRRHRARLALETVSEALRRNLDRHIASHARIEGAVHLTHAASTERRQNLVRAEMCPGRDGHMHPVV